MLVMDTPNKKQQKSLNDILMELADKVDEMSESQKAVTNAYIETLKEAKEEMDKGVTAQSPSPVAPTL